MICRISQCIVTKAIIGNLTNTVHVNNAEVMISLNGYSMWVYTSVNELVVIQKQKSVF